MKCRRSRQRRRHKRVEDLLDRSLSRKDDALSTEIDLVDRYLAAVKPEIVDLVLFNSTGAPVRSFPDRAAVSSALKATQYRGGTSFAVFRTRKSPTLPFACCFPTASAPSIGATPSSRRVS